MNADDSERLRRIETAVCGDEKAGIPGLGKRVTDVETKQSRLELKIAGFSGGFAVVIWILEKAYSVFGK